MNHVSAVNTGLAGWFNCVININASLYELIWVKWTVGFFFWGGCAYKSSSLPNDISTHTHTHGHVFCVLLGVIGTHCSDMSSTYWPLEIILSCECSTTYNKHEARFKNKQP